jgi:isocitrate/isopropylmalate dehydrogenase
MRGDASAAEEKRVSEVVSGAAKRVVVIQGEDASPEAMGPSVALLEGLGLPIEWLPVEVGAPAKRNTGSVFPDGAREAIDSADATLFGSTSGPSAAALFHLRWGCRTFANVRPARWMPGARSPLARPEGVDFTIVRENLEDLYLGLEGDIEELAPLGIDVRRAGRKLSDYSPARYALKVISEQGSRDVIGFSFEWARRGKAAGRTGRLTVSSKYNMLPKSDGYFCDIARELAGDYPDIEFETFIIDDFGQRLVMHPHDLDVVVMPNLYGDIMSDTAAGLIGGLGLAPSGCFGHDYAYFESAHGTAPDIAGQGIINPTATLLSGAMLLSHLGFEEAAQRLRAAIDEVYREGVALTPDQGGSGTTLGFCGAVESALESA